MQSNSTSCVCAKKITKFQRRRLFMGFNQFLFVIYFYCLLYEKKFITVRPINERNSFIDKLEFNDFFRLIAIDESSCVSLWPESNGFLTHYLYWITETS